MFEKFSPNDLFYTVLVLVSGGYGNASSGITQDLSYEERETVRPYRTGSCLKV